MLGLVCGKEKGFYLLGIAMDPEMKSFHSCLGKTFKTFFSLGASNSVLVEHGRIGQEFSCVESKVGVCIQLLERQS